MRVALVTAAGAGIGEATALRLARDGLRVAVADRDAAAVERLAADLPAHADALPLVFDLVDPAAVDEALRQVVEHFGRLDVLINGVGGWSGPQRGVADTTPEQWHQGLTLNVTSAFLCARAALPHLIRAGPDGRLVNLSSEVARAQVHFTTPEYAAGKAALLALTRYLAKELGPSGATANAVAPGPTWSPRTSATWTPELVAQIQRDTPNGRIADPDDIAAVIAFLVSDGARHVTGATIDVTGGHILV